MNLPIGLTGSPKMKSQGRINFNFYKFAKSLVKKGLKPFLKKKQQVKKGKPKSLNDYTIKAIISESSISTVYKATCKLTNQKVIIKKSKNNINSVSEINLSKIAYSSSPTYTLPVLAEFLDQNEEHIYYVQQEFGTSLYEFMVDRQAPLSLNEARYVYKQVLSCLLELQNNSDLPIYHLDVKEENILIDPDTFSIKIIDFGVSRSEPISWIPATLKSKGSYGSYGSKEFYSPEIYLKNTNMSTLPKHDVWSLGVAIYSSITGQLPYKSIGHVVREGFPWRDLEFSKLSVEILEIFGFIFVTDPEFRIDFEELSQCAFFQ